MKPLLALLFLFPVLLTAQCYGSFEVFYGAGVSGTTNYNSSELTDNPPVFVNRFGFGASFAIGQRTLLRTSFQFNQYGSRASIDGSDLRWGTQSDGMGGIDPTLPSGEPFTKFDITNKHLYAEGMLALRYEFRTRNRLRPFVEGGLAIGKYGTTSSVTDNGEDVSVLVRQQRVSRSIVPIGRIGAGLNYNFNYNVGVYAMPVLQYQLQSQLKEEFRNSRSWQTTLEIGVRVFVDPR